MAITILVHAAGAIVRWRERRRTIAALATLSDRLLRDVGIERRDIHRLATTAAERATARTAPRLLPHRGVPAANDKCLPRATQ